MILIDTTRGVHDSEADLSNKVRVSYPEKQRYFFLGIPEFKVSIYAYFSINYLAKLCFVASLNFEVST